jgi:hypothetical protein
MSISWLGPTESAGQITSKERKGHHKPIKCSAEKIIKKFVTYLYHEEYCITVVELGVMGFRKGKKH